MDNFDLEDTPVIDDSTVKPVGEEITDIKDTEVRLPSDNPKPVKPTDSPGNPTAKA